jgi:hypothetical protein
LTRPLSGNTTPWSSSQTTSLVQNNAALQLTRPLSGNTTPWGSSQTTSLVQNNAALQFRDPPALSE